jgi:hypothetical protein
MVLEKVNKNRGGSGDYLPAFEMISSLVQHMRGNNVGLYFLSDGAPSDRIEPGEGSVAKRQYELISDSVKGMAEMFGPRLTYSLNLLGDTSIGTLNWLRSQRRNLIKLGGDDLEDALKELELREDEEISVVERIDKELSSYRCTGLMSAVSASSASMSASMTSFSKLTEVKDDAKTAPSTKAEKIIRWEKKVRWASEAAIGD